MDLKTYLDKLPAGGRAAFARKLGIGRVYLAQLATKYHGRQPSPGLCWQIEDATNGVVSRVDLRNDATTIWPDLVQPDAAPTPQRRSTDHPKAAAR